MHIGIDPESDYTIAMGLALPIFQFSAYKNVSHGKCGIRFLYKGNPLVKKMPVVVFFFKKHRRAGSGAPVIHYNFSTSSSQIRPEASLGIRQSPLGLRQTEPTFTPSGRQLRLNCWVKNRR